MPLVNYTLDEIEFGERDTNKLIHYLKFQNSLPDILQYLARRLLKHQGNAIDLRVEIIIHGKVDDSQLKETT